MNVFHENDNYKVANSVYESEHSYDVFNKVTGALEHKADTLPEAIDFAEHNNTYLVNRLWEWISAKGSELKAEQDSSTFPTTG